MDQATEENIRTAVQVGASEEAQRMINGRQTAEHALTGPLGTFGKPKPNPRTHRRPPVPAWWRGKVPAE